MTYHWWIIWNRDAQLRSSVRISAHCICDDAMLSVFGKVTGNIDQLMLSCGQIICFGLLLIWVILAICKKRDLSAITFLMIGMFQIFLSKIGLADGGNYLYLIVGIILSILAGIILTAKDKKKYLLAIMPALWGIGGITLLCRRL